MLFLSFTIALHKYLKVYIRKRAQMELYLDNWVAIVNLRPTLVHRCPRPTWVRQVRQVRSWQRPTWVRRYPIHTTNFLSTF